MSFLVTNVLVFISLRVFVCVRAQVVRVQERPGGEGEPQQGAAGGGAVSALRSPAGLRRDAQGDADVKKKK